jgi:hypothetical protein
MRARKRRPRTVRCRRCKAAIKVKRKGPLPLYCSQTCRQLAYERRRYSGPMVALAQDLAHVRVRDVIRKELWLLLQQLNLVPREPKSPPPRPRIKPTANHLRLVDKTETPEA